MMTAAVDEDGEINVLAGAACLRAVDMLDAVLRTGLLGRGMSGICGFVSFTLHAVWHLIIMSLVVVSEPEMKEMKETKVG